MGDHGQAPAGDLDVVQVLVRQHALVRSMFDEVERTPATRRAQPFTRLARLLVIHETTESEILHPYARRVLREGADVVADRLGEAQEIATLLNRLYRHGVDDPDFMTGFRRLRQLVLAHARAEERYEFVRLIAQIDPAERRAMAVRVHAAATLVHEASNPRHTDGDHWGEPLETVISRTRDIIHHNTSEHRHSRPWAGHDKPSPKTAAHRR